ncbi:hypothetical protein L207DRAFT_514311 [Hyaloscypha variabilis F]|uniref:Uncharacterized protein n=1 Tax=Hyaloscypha variabilis (strain UAMH 11265 / GT02V1 / F) TaxID=1149755 RepID=A0A2J6RIQ1_HYAVF|nr:hypothetical protein L207DRAFT_514311 [Hyaloscypha variabilis F]
MIVKHKQLCLKIFYNISSPKTFHLASAHAPFNAASHDLSWHQDINSSVRKRLSFQGLSIPDYYHCQGHYQDKDLKIS